MKLRRVSDRLKCRAKRKHKATSLKCIMTMPGPIGAAIKYTRRVVVLEIPPISSPQTEVQAAMAAQIVKQNFPSSLKLRDVTNVSIELVSTAT